MDDTTGRVEGTDPVDRQTQDIRRDIAHTREEMSETIDAIQDKLRPGNIVSSATERVKHATSERVRQMTRSASNLMSGSRYENGGSGGFVGSVRHNPVPAALIGIGAAWWLMSSRSSAGSRGASWHDDETRADNLDDRGRRAYEHVGGPDGEELENDGSEYGTDYSRTGYPRTAGAYREYDRGYSSGTGFIERVKQNPMPAALAGLGLGWLVFSSSGSSDTWTARSGDRNPYRTMDEDAGAGMLSGVSEKVSDAASDVSETAQQVSARAQAYARDTTERARRTGRRAQSGLERMTRENPLAVGAGALLLGAAIGLAIPETERENEWLGETRDTVIDKAQDMARTAASRAQDAASDLAGEAASRIVGGTQA